LIVVQGDSSVVHDDVCFVNVDFVVFDDDDAPVVFDDGF
jgi:hypothetical protein